MGKIQTNARINDTMYSFELKKVSEHKQLSDETPCFSADLYIDGKKIASVQNRGNGEMDSFYYVDNQMSAQWRKHETELSTIIYGLLDMRERSAYVKRHQKDRIVFMDSNKELRTLHWCTKGGHRVPIERMLAEHLSTVQKSVRDIEKNGGAVLNTNLEGIKVKTKKQ